MTTEETCGAGALSRRAALGGLSAAVLPTVLRAQAPAELEVGVVDSFSGPWAFNGQLGLKGAQLAVDEINAAGGVRALAGAKLKLVSADAGGTPEEATAAVRRLLAASPNLIGGTGAFISSLQLAITEVTERAGIPWIVMGAADQLTERGFRNVFATNMSSSQAALRIPPLLGKVMQLATGDVLKDVAIVGDNTASSVAFTDGIRKDFAAHGVKVVYDETYSVGISDGSAIAQKIRRAKPSLWLFMNSVPQDAKIIIGALNRVNVTMSKLPTFIFGASSFIPEMLGIVDKEIMQGAIGWATNWTTRDSMDLEQAWTKRSGEPWMTYEPRHAYGHIWMFKEALEQAGAADRAQTSDKLRTMHATSGPITKALGGAVQFDAKGRRTDPTLFLMQWQDGVAATIYPENEAIAKPLRLG